MFFRRLKLERCGVVHIVSAISYAIILAGLIVMALHWWQHGSPLRLGRRLRAHGCTVKVRPARSAERLQAAMAKIQVNGCPGQYASKTGDAEGSRWSIETQTDFGNDPRQAVGFARSGGADRRTQSAISSVAPSLSHEYLLKRCWR